MAKSRKEAAKSFTPVNTNSKPDPSPHYPAPALPVFTSPYSQRPTGGEPQASDPKPSGPQSDGQHDAPAPMDPDRRTY